MNEKRKSVFEHRERLDIALFILAVLVYSFSRLVALEKFPIYFLSDEAIQTVLAADFLRDGLRGTDGVFLPTYFENSFFYNLSLSVYLQVIPTILFGKSVLVTRLVPVLITISASTALGLMMRQVYKNAMWWSAVLFLALTPSWFLHSRTALEVSLFVSFFTWMLYFYLRYRYDNPRYLFLTVVSGALAFYSYNAAQIIITALAASLFLSDFRYHLRHTRIILGGAALSILFAIPYIRFQIQHGGEAYFHLRLMDSYLLHPIPPIEKVLTFLSNYLTGLDPRYWYSPVTEELSRHILKGYGNICILTFPFALMGILQLLRHLGESKNRTLLIALLTAPLGGTIVGIGITRVLVFVVPVAALSSLGLSSLANHIERKITYPVLAVLSFMALGAGAVYMTVDAIENGPRWFDDYGLTGMQYGGPQMYEAVNEISKSDPGTEIFVSPTWANGADVVKRFFIPDDRNVFMGNADAFLNEPTSNFNKTVFVLTPSEFRDARNNTKVGKIEIKRTIPYPDGRDGFYFVRMDYSPEAPSIFEAEREERQRPRKKTIRIGGELVTVEYPFLDMGEIEHAFDGDAFTFARVYEAYPAVITISYPSARELSGVRVTTGSMDYTLCTHLSRAPGDPARSYCEEYSGLPDDPTVDLVFKDGPLLLEAIALEFITQKPGGSFRLHVREIDPY
jgi:4-amino-4-deoxy-L-arabinose transferase-like glycosyltransferase